MGKTTGQPLLKNGSLYGEPKEVALSDDGSGSYVGTNAGTGEENVTEEVAQPPTFNHTPSDTFIAANKLLADQWNSMPGAYQSQWNSKINDYMSKIENRDPFSYNFNEDALYQMYKDHYTQMGQMAMMDTMGQAAAMTGGYGNSYAQTVGQQAYNQQLTQLNNIIPELYQMAYARYRDEGQDLLNMYNMYMDRENQDYGRYQDNLSNWWKETDYLAGRADTEYNRDYNSQWDSYTAENDAYWKEYNANYQEGRDAVKDQNDAYDRLAGLIGSTGYEPTADELAAAGMSQEQANAYLKAYQDSKVSVGGGDTPTGNPQSGATSIPDYIISQASSFTTNEDLAQYLDEQTSLGKITEAQADDLYAQYKKPSKVGLSNRTWTVVDDGGLNWFWGVDGNAKVKDQYGTTYTMDQLVDALVAEGMKKSEAKDYVENLQKKLGI